MTDNAATAGIGQLVKTKRALYGEVSRLLTERGLSFEQAEAVIRNGGDAKVTEVAEGIVGKILEMFPVDPVISYKKDLEEFYAKVYGKYIDLSKMEFPSIEGRDHYMFVSPFIATSAIYAAFVKIDMPSMKYGVGATSEKKKKQQARPMRSYVFAHRGTVEPDKKHLKRNYADFISDGKNYMTADEYMLCCQFMWWKFKRLLDQKGSTITSTADKDNNGIHGFCRKGIFKLGSIFRTKGYPDSGPREIFLR